MFSHIMIGTNDLEKAKTFYDAILGTLDVKPATIDGHRMFYMTPTGVLSITKPINGQPATAANGGTIGLPARRPRRPMPGMRPASQTAGQPARIPPACVKAHRASFTSPICATPMATSSAPCTGWAEP